MIFFNFWLILGQGKKRIERREWRVVKARRPVDIWGMGHG
jgi:hypothetical protein